MRKPLRVRLLLSFVLAGLASSLSAQVRVEIPAPSGSVNVTYTDPAEQGQAERLRDLVLRVKPLADQLYDVEHIEVVIVRSQRELDLRLGPRRAGALAGISYVHGILFLSPLSWEGNPTEEALEHEMEQAVARYAANQLAGGHRLPAWLEEGLVSVLTRRSFPPTTADLVEGRAALLLAQSEESDPAVGYWAVRYLAEARGGLGLLRQLLRLVAQRPDNFLENLRLVYGVPVGTLERDWRAWLRQLVEEAGKGEGRVREGPLIKQD